MKMEKFVRDQMPDVPAVTIRKNGSVCLNQKVIDEFKLTKMRFASSTKSCRHGAAASANTMFCSTAGLVLA